MAKTPSKSWLPKRSGSSGRFLTAKEGSDRARTTETEKIGSEGRSSNTHYRSSVSGRFVLPNGEYITTVRKDVMDRALGRGEFKKK
ncbi:hypothetical protein DMC47_19030 [Nostoc sp. 3335mG]|nr:hypothetical protein DMC47_19030 [Nostoc sp. 3335mG]